MKRSSRIKWTTHLDEIESASKFHNQVRELIIQDPFLRGLKCYQEVNVQELIPEYPYHNHHYDWYIEELLCVIELHGAQHYKVVNYGNSAAVDAIRDFAKIQERDNFKKHAALNAGFKYVEIPYTKQKQLHTGGLRRLILE